MENPGNDEGDDLKPTETQGYKAPDMKTMQELQELDQNDESLKKWKESLLKGAQGKRVHF
jgi:Rho GDP-dissociation inhibitor